MEAQSLVWKARTAFNSAAAKAERVFTDIKSDFILVTDPRGGEESDDSPIPRPDVNSKVCNNEGKNVAKKDWQDRFRNIRRRGGGGVGRVDEQQQQLDKTEMAVPFYDDNLYILNMKNDIETRASEVVSLLEDSYVDTNKIPPSSIIKQLAVAVEGGKKIRSMKYLMSSCGTSSPVRERASLTLSAVKSLVLRDREDKVASDFCGDDRVLALIHNLFDADGNFLRRKIHAASEVPNQLPKDIHGAPPDCFLVKLSEVIGSFKTLRKMALFWSKILRKVWDEGNYLPGIPTDEIPDLRSCLLYQQLQVINCCVSRKLRFADATESVDSVMRDGNPNAEDVAVPEDIPAGPLLYARHSSGELVLRLGADRPTCNLRMLETGEPIYAPITQEGPLLTEDLIKETEELVLRTGSMGAGCSQLLSDMQAFKAANPGCILEDFVRWHSPPDWTESEPSSKDKDSCNGGGSSSTRGQLSSRMQKEGNLWRELWDTSKPVPAVKQAPLFDEDLAVEGILDHFEDMQPSEFFEQLFLSLLGLGFVLAEPAISTNDELSKLFFECKEYVIATCQGSQWSEKIDELCQVYETVDNMLRQPEEVLKMVRQSEEATNIPGESKRSRFMGLRINFGGKDKQRKLPDYKEGEVTPTRQPFASFFDGKSSLFSKKPPKPDVACASSPLEKSITPSLNEGWTMVYKQ
ncbi:hypothetical protein ACFE04_023061 [Oxalis oulophora]